MPMQFGPIRRIPCVAADRDELLLQRPARRLRSRRNPPRSRPDPRTPFSPHSRATCATTWRRDHDERDVDGSPGISAIEWYAGTPWTTSALRVHRVDRPVEPGLDQVVEQLTPPMLDASRDAPITATDRGERNIRIASIAASVLALPRSARRPRSESEVGNSTSIVPGSARIETRESAARKTLIMRWFSGSTSATKMRHVVLVRVCASWPIRIEPRPLPCMLVRNAQPTAQPCRRRCGCTGRRRSSLPSSPPASARSVRWSW